MPLIEVDSLTKIYGSKNERYARKGGDVGRKTGDVGRKTKTALDGVGTNGGVGVALDDVTCTFETGKITALIGVNGAGKSTLLNILAMNLYKTSGSVKIDGEEITDDNMIRMKNRIGFVSENAIFYGDMTVQELLENTLEFYGRKKLFSKIATMCGIELVLCKKIKTLSKGYRQRLSFALALSNESDILILDEPMTALDPIQINEIRNLILSLKKDRTIIFSTHIMQEVNALCDKIIILNDGKILASGTESDILEKTKCSNLEDAFLTLTTASKEGENG